MTNPYQKAYDAAIAERSSILENRVTEDQRLAQLDKIIDSLGPLVEDESKEIVQPIPILIPATASLADACRVTLQAYNRFMMPSTIRDVLRASGYDESRFTNMLASIHSVCARFAESGEADKQLVDGKTFYRWAGKQITGFSGVSANKLADLKNVGEVIRRRHPVKYPTPDAPPKRSILEIGAKALDDAIHPKKS